MKFNHLKVPNQWQHYWTKYPEGYTILEALIEWVSQVNKMVDNQNDLNKIVDNFVQTFDKNLQEKVIDTLREWQESGFLDIIIDEALQTQIDDVSDRLAQMTYNVFDYGAIGDGITDDSQAIQDAIDTISSNGGGVLSLGKTHLINKPVILADNVTIKPYQTTVIRSELAGVTFNIPSGTKNVRIEGIEFDYDNVFSNYAIDVGENVEGLVLKDLSFSNFHESDYTKQQNIIRLRTGVKGLIDNIRFKNITIVGNRVIGDGGGAGRCIRTTDYGVVYPKDFNLNISNIFAENCYNVDIDGNIMIEDFDVLHFQHGSVRGINVSNITAKNVNKRVIKVQGDGVNISNVTVNTDVRMSWVIGIIGANHVTINNINANGNINSLVDFNRCSDIDISNAILTSNQQVAGSIFSFKNVTDVAISQVKAKGHSGLIFSPDENGLIQNISLDHVTLNVIGHIVDMNLVGTSFTGTMENIKITNSTLNAEHSTYGQPLIHIFGTDNYTIKNIAFDNTTFKGKQNYIFGFAVIRNSENVDIKDCNFIITDGDEDAITIRYDNTNGMLRHNKTDIGYTTYRTLDITGSSDVLIIRSQIPTIAMVGVNCLLELEKNTSEITYLDGATESQVTIS